ncbi:hypothetical protein I4U23_013342 [Adineta vaga]|nr:hypothetical protein I4U23_013342 [Adineta vaga]
MSETVATTPPASPTTPLATKKEDEVKKATANGSNTKKFEGDGLPFKAKLIGMEDLTVDRDEKICLDSMLKLKAIVSLRGEHKQRIQLNLTMNTVKIFDEATKAQIACHEIERISFVVIDPRDTRAFGYIYNTSDDRHQFWAIKTERAAAATVLALKELFELAFEQYTNAEKAKDDTSKVETKPSVPSETINLIQETPQVSSVHVPQLVSAAPPSLFDDAFTLGDTPAPAPQPILESDDWLGTNNTTTSNSQQQPPESVDTMVLLGGISFTPVSNQTSTTNSNELSGLFSTPVPQPPQPTNPYGSFYAQTNPINNMSPFIQQQQQQQRPSTPSTIPFQPLQPQQNLMTPSPISPTPPPPPAATSPFATFDVLGGLSSGTSAKTTKESFFPSTAPKTIQQMQMEKQP